MTSSLLFVWFVVKFNLIKTKPIVDKPVEDMTNAELWAVFFQYLTDTERRAKIMKVTKKDLNF